MDVITIHSGEPSGLRGCIFIHGLLPMVVPIHAADVCSLKKERFACKKEYVWLPGRSIAL